MARARMTRWVCPLCGNGKNAPTRPRKDDTRRYCLPCSDSTGRLVERSAPTLEARRAAKTIARAESAKRARARERERQTERHTAAGIDVRAEWKRLLALPYVRQLLPRRDVPLTVAWSKVKDYTTGHAHYGGGSVHLTFFEGVQAYEVKNVMAHELAHVIASDRGHGEAFRRTFALVLFHAYNVAPSSWPHLAGTKYEVDAAAERALAEQEGAAPDSRRVVSVEVA